MMKEAFKMPKISLLAKWCLMLFLVINGSVFAQNRSILLSESFDENQGFNLPSGWTIAGSGQSNWYISGTSNAGGNANEVRLEGYPYFNGTTRLVTPPINLSGIEEVVVSFKHCVQNHSTSTFSHTIGIATATDMLHWHSGWSETFSENGVWSVTQVISTADMGLENVQFCLYYTGSSVYLDQWYFDDISIVTYSELDASLNKLWLNDYIPAGETPIIFDITNSGRQPIQSLQVAYDAGAGMVTENFTNLHLLSLQDTTLTFAENAFLPLGEQEVTIWISEINGVANDEDILQRHFTVVSGIAEKRVMIEHFSSSTCPPCVNVNIEMEALTAANAGRFCYVKYPMNWPGNGDPYYRPEFGQRRDYYNVTGVPEVIIDGGVFNMSIAPTQVQFDLLNNAIALTDIVASFDANEQIINVKVDVFPVQNYANARLFVVINEKETTNNIGTNGETSFHHVAMAMNGSTGTAIDLVAGTLQHFEFEQDMSNTFVEEMNDLEVAVFIQDLAQTTVLNSRFAYEYTPIHPFPPENIVAERANNQLVVTWENHEGTQPTGYRIVINNVLVADNHPTTSFTLPDAVRDFYAVQITARYNDLLSVPVTAIATHCNPPTNLTATLAENNVQLTWEAEDNALIYKVYRGINNSEFELVATTENTTLTDVLPPAKDQDFECCYNVTARCNAETESMPSNTACVEWVVLSDCNPPTNLTTTLAENSTQLTWEAEDNALMFNVFRSTNDGELELIATTASTTLTETIAEGTEDFTQFCYYVTTLCSEDRESEMSDNECVVINSIDEHAEIVKIYPNPASDFVRIEGEKITNIMIYNMLGQLIHTKIVNCCSSTEITINDLNKGVYLFEIQMMNDRVVKKIVTIQ